MNKPNSNQQKNKELTHFRKNAVVFRCHRQSCYFLSSLSLSLSIHTNIKEQSLHINIFFLWLKKIYKAIKICVKLLKLKRSFLPTALLKSIQIGSYGYKQKKKDLNTQIHSWNHQRDKNGIEKKL